MSRRLVVLKFGSSVLRSREDIFTIVHEVYRWLREGYRVVAVVSAIGDCTNELLRTARSYGDDAQNQTRGLLISTGELHSAALLGLALDRCGIPNQVMTANQIGLRTRGSSLDAMPCELNAEYIHKTFDHTSTIVVPGFIGHDRCGNTTLFGRGGSDLTAVFLAHRLNAARCRLIKDVDGLFEYDPNSDGPRPSKFRELAWRSALQLDESIVQHKTIEFASRKGQEIEIAALNSCWPSVIGDVSIDSVFNRQLTHDRVWRVGILGFGVVGRGVFERLSQLRDRFSIAGIVVRNKARALENGAPESILFDNPNVLVNEVGCDILVEAIGGRDAASMAAHLALENGVHVVTANKSLIADRGPQLEELAERYCASITYSSAVGGGAPVLERVNSIDDPSQIREVFGILNGTANYVLDCLSAGDSFDAAVRNAQQRGFAERNPSRDLDGTDAAEKLIILANKIGVDLEFSQIRREEIGPGVVQKLASAHNRPVKQVARLTLDAADIEARISLEPVPRDHRLARVRGADNLVIFATQDGEQHSVFGRGAGRWPTTESVIGDLLQLDREQRSYWTPAAAECAAGQRCEVLS